MIRRVAAAWRAWRQAHPSVLQRHLRDDNELVRDLRMLAAARDPAVAEEMERQARAGDAAAGRLTPPWGPPDSDRRRP